jgi:hypothetical protein
VVADSTGQPIAIESIAIETSIVYAVIVYADPIELVALLILLQLSIGTIAWARQAGRGGGRRRDQRAGAAGRRPGRRRRFPAAAEVLLRRRGRQDTARPGRAATLRRREALRLAG